MSLSTAKEPNQKLSEYPVWDKGVRIFHWINFLCVLGLIGVGLVIWYNKTLGVSADGKVLLKTIHVLIGYVFALNLSWRLIWAFIGNRYARWGAILPWGKAYFCSLKNYIDSLKKGQPPEYAGHNPIARLMVAFLLCLLLIQGITGLVLAGTDIYYPPLGNHIAEWVTGGDPEKLKQLQPGSKDFVVKELYEEMRAFRKPFSETHEIVFFTLLAAVFLHILAVVVTEVKERNGLVSAMFTGKKVLKNTPKDL